MSLKSKPVYADNHASTPVDPKVIKVVNNAMKTLHGNPSSLQHIYGLEATFALVNARKTVAHYINAESHENIIFTSGATEANNCAIFSLSMRSEYGRVICSSLEHKSVLEPINNCFHTILPIPFNKDFEIDFEKLANNIEALEGKIDFISLMHANNEIGTIFQIKEMGVIAKRFNIPFHVDASQSAAWLPIDVQECNIDYLTLSAHKMYGPKGIGAIYCSDHMNLESLFFGGDQEFGKRVGTQNVSGIIGLAKAMELAHDQKKKDSQRIGLIRTKIEKNFANKLGNVDFRVNGGKNRLPNNLSVTFYGLRPGLLDLVNSQVALSDGSACQSGDDEVSHVLRAVGHTDSSQTLRIGLGRFTTQNDARIIIKSIIKAVKRLK